MTEEQRRSLEYSNRLAQELLDRDWLALGVTQEELDQDRLEVQWMNAEMDKGRKLDDIIKELEEKESDKPQRKRSRKPTTAKSPTAVRP